MKKSIPVIFAGFLMSISILFADGDSRPATQAEKDFTINVLRTLESSIPAIPSGWTLEEKSEIRAPETVTAGTEKYQVQAEYRQSWQHPAKLEEARIREEQMIAEMAVSMQQDQKGLEETSNRMNALAEEFGKAIEKNDAAEVARIQAEMEALGQQLNAVGDAQSKEIEARQQEIKPKDARVRFMFRVNATHFDISRYTRDADLAGLQVYRQESDDPNASIEGEFVVFTGNFAPKKYEFETWMELATDPSAPSTAVQSIVLTVEGDKAHTRQLLESMDWTALKALLIK